MSKALEAAIYDRVSDDRTRERRSVGQQNTANRAACSANGWVVAGVYEDNDLSASRFARGDRPDWERLLADLEPRRIDVLVMWEPSRGNRELEMWARLLNACRRRGTLIHITSHDHTYDVRKPRDWKALADEGVAAAYASEETSLRVLRDKAAMAIEGKPHGRVLYGYRREYDVRTGQLVRQVLDVRRQFAIRSACLVRSTPPMPVEVYTRAGLVDSLATRALKSVAPHALAAELNQRGIPTPRRSLTGWSHSQVRDLLLNPGYAALRVHQGAIVGPADWDPIIRPEQHYSLVALLTAPERRTSRDVAIKHLLSGIALCGVCGSDLRVQPSRGRLTYICRPRQAGASGMGHVGRGKDRLEEFVVEVVLSRLASDEMQKSLAQAGDDDPELSGVLAEIATLRDRLLVIYSQGASGDLSPMAVAHMEKEIQPRIDRLEARARSMRSAPLVHAVADPDFQVVVDRWMALTMPQQRELLRAMCERIEVLPVGPGRKNYADWEYTRIIWRGQSAEQTGVDAE
ncbi:recombinase family protein [Nonomuraea sp. NPDC023979]|uniref:recombinase family protein n=1 Tax=Nonomuraea sp. NPDC023979 TaxID=3154796 RepID=UPI00340E0237